MTHIGQLNVDQKKAFNTVIAAVESKIGKVFFLQGLVGTRKTFIYSTICHYLRAKSKIVLYYKAQYGS